MMVRNLVNNQRRNLEKLRQLEAGVTIKNSFTSSARNSFAVVTTTN
jgi:hypothetical protein